MSIKNIQDVEKNKNWYEKFLFKIKLKYYKLSLFVTIVFLGLLCSGCNNINLQNDYISEKEKWIVVKDEMDKPREPVTANLLPDGNVLIMGGINKSTDTAEIFDPNQMKIIKSIPLDDKRYFEYNAVNLQNGNIYIIGGYVFQNKKYPNLPELTNTTKIFDSKTYTFKNTKSIKNISTQLRTFLLKNGNVLIITNPMGVTSDEYEKRKNIKFEIYDPLKDTYYETKNNIHKMAIGTKNIILDNGDIILSVYGNFKKNRDKTFGSGSLYKFNENRFTEFEELPTEQLFIQLDNENYFTIKPEQTTSSGYVYNIKTKQKIPVKNKIDRTFYSATSSHPKLVLLRNGNVLIIGISLRKKPITTTPSHYNRKNPYNYNYSTYIYDRKKNIFYKISSPPIKMDNNTASVMLKNGDILFAGGRSDSKGKKIQIYKYGN